MSSFIFGRSRAMEELLLLISRIAASELPVFIEGETGTGKSLLAKQIHALSRRASNKLIKLDCATLPPNLVESELFGHEKGSYTGAVESKAGIFEIADGGTIFLEEIENLQHPIQTKLLTVLEDKRIRRIGGKKDICVDFRILSASNDHIQNKIEDGIFRKDLFFRLRGTRLYLPPLRERPEDILELAEHFLQKYNIDYNGKKHFAEEVKPCLRRYPWPGNVRELKFAVEEAALKSESDEIRTSDFSLDLTRTPLLNHNESHLSLAELEKKHIGVVLSSVAFNKSQAAKILGIGLNTLYRKLKRYGINDT